MEWKEKGKGMLQHKIENHPTFHDCSIVFLFVASLYQQAKGYISVSVTAQ